MNHRHLMLPLLLAGCALTRNAPPLEIHYFSPDPETGAETGAPATAPTRGDGAALRLGRITRSDHLRYRIVRRASEVELVIYESRRWTERPDEYVRRVLGDELFHRRGIGQTMAGPAPILDVEVVEFEEVMTPRHVGRVQLRYVLHDHRVVFASGRRIAERPVEGDDFAAVVRAIGGAMNAAAAAVADDIVRELAGLPPAQ